MEINRRYLFKHIHNAWIGRKYWLRLKKQYEIDKNEIFVIVMPETDRELNYYALAHLNNLIAKRYIHGVVIITADKWVINSAREFSNKIIDIIEWQNTQIELLIKYYAFYKFSTKFIVVSLDKPHGNNGYMAVGVHGVTKEDLLCLGIYCMRNVPKLDKDKYKEVALL